MIVTITLNPAIDKTIYHNKTVFDIGGKGINVSKVLNSINADSFCIGIIGKDNKDIIIDELNRLNINNHFIETEGRVRVNTKYIKDNNLYEENENGPYIDIDTINTFIEYIKQFKDDVIVISGSVPSNVDKDIYQRLIEILKDNNNYVIVDCDLDLLSNAIKAKPNAIKPNRKEICDLFDIEYDKDLIIHKAKQLALDLVVISLDKDGALFIDKNDVYYCKALDLEYKSSLAAGDSMVAAIAYGKDNNMDIKDIIRLAMALASASVEMEGSKPPRYEDVVKFIDLVKIDKIS